MGSNVERVKERLDIVDVIGNHVKLERAGLNFKARCPFHNEKTPSFFVSPTRQNYYCFGCGAKGDIFTFVEETEGVDFREALKLLADRAGVVLEYNANESLETRTEKDRIANILNEAAAFFERALAKNKQIAEYLLKRGVSPDSVAKWRVGFAPDEWRALSTHLITLGYPPDAIIKAGLAKKGKTGGEKDPYDVFRNRIIFPLSDQSGRIIAFSGRAVLSEAQPKYLNSPDTILFKKSEVLYGLDRAKEEIRRKNYSVLVEGQIDLVLSHQAGITNTVAASGTAFTTTHLLRLKRLSPRIILGFDGDSAGERAAFKSTRLGLSLGMEVKMVSLPRGKDPAELVSEDPKTWKNVLRESQPAIEYFLDRIIETESDARQRGKQVERVVLPLIALLSSAIERSHFISLVSKRLSVREEFLWEDLRKVKIENLETGLPQEKEIEPPAVPVKTQQQKIQERLRELEIWRPELPSEGEEHEKLVREEAELRDHLSQEILREELANLLLRLATAERTKDESKLKDLTQEIRVLHQEVAALEDRRKKV